MLAGIGLAIFMGALQIAVLTSLGVLLIVVGFGWWVVAQVIRAAA